MNQIDDDNILAQQLSRANRAIDPYSKFIAVAVAAVVIGGLAWMFLTSNDTARRSDATMQLIQASGRNDPEVLDRVHSTYAGTLAAAWAGIYRADDLLDAGIRDLYVDRVSAEEQIDEAIAAYERTLTEAADDRVLRSRAHLGLAKAHEAKGDVEPAVAAYREVAAAAESDAAVEFAQDRVAVLESPSTGAFLAWFDKQEFAPAEPSLPPDLPSTLPDLPDLDLPDLDLPDLDLPEIASSADDDKDDATESVEAEADATDGSDAEMVEVDASEEANLPNDADSGDADAGNNDSGDNNSGDSDSGDSDSGDADAGNNDPGDNDDGE